MILKFDLENCYGIKKLDYTFTLSAHEPITIHSSNGTMKTSLCKTIQDVIDGRSTKDLIYPGNVTRRNILINGMPATPLQLHVVKSYKDYETKESISKILIDSKLKTIYETLINAETSLVNSIIATFAKSVGIREDKAEALLRKIFRGDSTSQTLLKALSKLNKKRIKAKITYKYNDIFNEQVLKFTQTGNIATNIKLYTKQYVQLIKKSPIFTAGVFDLTNLGHVGNALSAENFFKGQNALFLKNYPTPIKSETDLNKVIQDQIDLISKDPKILAAFKEIESSSDANKGTAKVASLIKNDPEVAVGLSKMDEFEERYVLSHLITSKPDLINLQKSHKKIRGKAFRILLQAEKYKYTWEEVIEDFQNRFQMPFSVSMGNKKNAVLGLEEPVIHFMYDGKVDVPENTLKNDILSEGERRALYTLQFLFDVENIKKQSGEKVIFIDDLADSYDYTNKLALIEYLKDISQNPKIYLVVLTHNFDFYRSFGFRVSQRLNCFFANKEPLSTNIQQGEYLQNVFQVYKGKIGSDNRVAIACVPFARNLIEYTESNFLASKAYSFYTRLVHFRPYAQGISFKTIFKYFNKQFSQKYKTAVSQSFYSVLFDEAGKISLETPINQKLEDKLVIAIALRIRAEKYMYSRISTKDPSIKTRIATTEIGKLYDEYIKQFPKPTHISQMIQSICLLAPSTIHVNNFMYEPMIDFSITRFRSLYRDFVKAVKTF